VLDAMKLKTVTYDAEICIGFNSNGDAVMATGLLHYFLRSGKKGDVNKNLYLICGRIAGITALTQVGETHAPLDYDIEIKALSVSVAYIFSYMNLIPTDGHHAFRS